MAASARTAAPSPCRVRICGWSPRASSRSSSWALVSSVSARSRCSSALSGSVRSSRTARWTACETLTRFCCAPSWRFRSSRFRSASPAETIRARERRISSSTCLRAVTSSPQRRYRTLPSASWTTVAVQSTTRRSPLGATCSYSTTPGGSPSRRRVKSSRARSTSCSAMNSVQNGLPIQDSSGMPAARSSAWLTPSRIPSSSTRARKLGVERTTARLKSRSRSSTRSWRVRSVKSRTMSTNSSGADATTRPS